MQTEAGDVLF